MKRNLRHVGEYAAMLLAWVGLLLLFGALSDRFLTPATFAALANRIPALLVVAAGMTLVLVIGGIDLSVGSVLGLSGAVLGAVMAEWQWGAFPASMLAIGIGLLIGMFNGLLIVRLRVPSFIVTLGMLEIARGLAYMVTRSETKYLGARIEDLGRTLPGLGISAAFILSVLIVIVTQLMLSRSVLGRKWIAIGTNETAVRLAGVGTTGPRILVFALSGMMAGVGAVFYTSRLGSADPNAGAGLELAAIAAVVIGGTSLMGGKGSVISTLLGVLIIATLEAGLAQVGAKEPMKRVITGSVIILAVMLDAWRHQFAGRKFGWLSRLINKGAAK